MFKRGDVCYGSYADYLMEWQHMIRTNRDWPIMIVYYEDMVQSSFGTLKKMVKFLGHEFSDDYMRQVDEFCKLETMKSKESVMLSKGDSVLCPLYRPSFSRFRKGTVGDWNNWFSDWEGRQMDEWWGEKNKENDMFHFRYALA